MSAEASRLLTLLEDGVVHLEPLGEEHREALGAACAQDEAIWPIYMASFAPEQFDASFDEYLANPARLMFACFAGGVLIGMTGYLNVEPAHRVLEIGSTYIAPPARGTGINARLKALMIDHAIGCGFERIEFRIDTRNARSMAAVAKLGAKIEGVLRRHRITWTGHRRDTALYAILADEWQARASGL